MNELDISLLIVHDETLGDYMKRLVICISAFLIGFPAHAARYVDFSFTAKGLYDDYSNFPWTGTFEKVLRTEDIAVTVDTQALPPNIGHTINFFSGLTYGASSFEFFENAQFYLAFSGSFAATDYSGAPISKTTPFLSTDMTSYYVFSQYMMVRAIPLSASILTIRTADTPFASESGLYRRTVSDTVINDAAVPEAATWAMMIIGVGAAGITMRMRRPMQTLTLTL